MQGIMGDFHLGASSSIYMLPQILFKEYAIPETTSCDVRGNHKCTIPGVLLLNYYGTTKICLCVNHISANVQYKTKS